MKFSATLFLVFSFFTSVLCSQVNKIDAKGLKQGAWEKKFPNSAMVAYKGQFKNDLPIGTFEYFYPTGEKKAKITHLPNSQKSKAIMYFESGNVMAIGNYVQQQKDSVWTYFSPIGKPRMKENYVKDQLQGERIIYYTSGYYTDEKLKIASKECFVKGLKEGESFEFFDDSVQTIKSKGIFKKGLKQGEYVYFYPTGTISIRENYLNDVLEKWQFAYKEDGSELGKRFFIKGKELKGKELEAFLKLNPLEIK